MVREKGVGRELVVICCERKFQNIPHRIAETTYGS